ncbi:MAG: TetR/AcrR family transcriptional regulator [Chloroflexi bacterium]|nr:MAG: TetR/AcrR family transcriptional regulator [Chloroflexota bacterium]
MDYTEHPNAERILQDGWELFQRKGYLGVSVDELCQRSGITKPTLYYYFKNKENLFVEVLLRRLQGFHEVIEQPGTLQERLECIAVVVLDSFKTDYAYLVRDLEHIHSPENALRVRQAFTNELFGPMTELMAEAVAAGQLNGEGRFLAHLFMGAVEVFIARAGEYGLDHAQLAKRLVAFFLQGACP